MRSRATVIFLVLALALAAVLVSSPVALGAESDIVVAQQPGGEGGVEGQEGADEGGEGQDDPDAESGAGEGETEEASTEATGPPWTYQMARITLVLLVLLALGLGYLYYRLVASRRKGV